MIALVFDTETTGLPKKRRASLKDNDNWPYIVQMSWLVCDMTTGEILGIKDYVVRLADDLSIPIESSNIHGITDEIMREKGVPIKGVLEDFWCDLQSAHYLVAHNLNFDKTITRVEMYRNGFRNMYKRTNTIEVCTMTDGAMICNISRLKTGLYYLRSRAKASPQQFTIAPTQKVPLEEEGICEMCSG